MTGNNKYIEIKAGKAVWLSKFEQNFVFLIFSFDSSSWGSWINFESFECFHCSWKQNRASSCQEKFLKAFPFVQQKQKKNANEINWTERKEDEYHQTRWTYQFCAVLRLTFNSKYENVYNIVIEMFSALFLSATIKIMADIKAAAIQMVYFLQHSSTCQISYGFDIIF